MRSSAILLAGAVLAAFTGTAQAGQGFYTGLMAGWSRPTDISFNNVNVAGTYRLGDGFIYGGSVGYKFLPGIRLEAEATHVKYAVTHSDAFGFLVPASGRVAVTSYFANALYDLPIFERWSLTAGAGVGAATVSPSITGDFDANGSDTRFAWQALAGVIYSVTDQIDIQIDGRFRRINNTFHWVTPPCGCNNDSWFGRQNAYTVMAGIRYFFNRVPVPIVVPPPPPPVRNFIVFFDFNKANLTAEAQQVIQEAVRTAVTSGMVRVIVTGHTDSVGSVAYNQDLSERRADAVKTEMVRLGLQANDVATSGRGFSDPIVNTGPGVREPQNRRAVIDVQ